MKEDDDEDDSSHLVMADLFVMEIRLSIKSPFCEVHAAAAAAESQI
jgi:hypothetical protein